MSGKEKKKEEKELGKGFLVQSISIDG